MAGQDPFYIIRQEIQDTVQDLNSKMSRYHGLQASNPERKKLSATVEEGCDSVAWQLNELDNAVDRASADPARFNLTVEELQSRRKWIQGVRRQIEATKDTIKNATQQRAAVFNAESKAVAANDKFLGDESQRQQLIMKQQDHELGDIEEAVIRIGRQGRAIGQELEEQGQMLEELDQDVDTTNSRLKAAQKKMQEIIRKSGSNTQLALIGTLIVILIILSVFAFM